MVHIIKTPLGKIRVPEPLAYGVDVEHIIVYPLPDRVNVQLLASADDGLVVVASATLERAVAARLLQVVAAGLEDTGPNENTMIIA